MPIQAGTDSGGTYEKVSEGVYTYTFATAFPADYDRTVTHTVAMYGSRNLSEFDLGTQYDNVDYSWVPDGRPVTVVRDVVQDRDLQQVSRSAFRSRGQPARGAALQYMPHASDNGSRHGPYRRL